MSGQHDVSRPASGNHAAGVSDFGPHAFADLLRSEGRRPFGEGERTPRRKVGQKGCDPLVHQAPIAGETCA